MRKFFCYLFGLFAAFNLIVIFPAMMSGAPANWIGQRFLCVLIFGGICFLLGRKKSNNSTMATHENKKEEATSVKVNENKSQEDIKENKQQSLFSSPETEDMAKELFKIASDAISEIIDASGKLDKKGLCEAIMFNSNIILNDPAFQKKSFYDATSNDYIILLYFLIQQQRTDLNGEKLMNFIKERMEFYSSEYNKLCNEKQYTPMRIYSTFYLTPLEDEPKPCLDILKLMTFHVGLINMVAKLHNLLDNKLEK